MAGKAMKQIRNVAQNAYMDGIKASVNQQMEYLVPRYLMALQNLSFWHRLGFCYALLIKRLVKQRSKGYAESSIP